METFAKENGLWIPFSDIYSLGHMGPCGSENDTFVNNGYIYKMNNLMHHGGLVSRLFQRIQWHNSLFPNTHYTLHAFTGFDGRSIYPILRQRFIVNALLPTMDELRNFMTRLGFTPTETENQWSNGTYTIGDICPRNVLKDSNGFFYVIDAEISMSGTPPASLIEG